MNNPFKPPIVILANGKFPKHEIAVKAFRSAGTLICADGSYNHLTNIGLKPHVIIGDLDSVNDLTNFDGLIINDSNQNNSDLEKCIDWSIMNGIKQVAIIGATGLREDMTVNNIMLLYRYFEKIDLKIITDHFTIFCNNGKNSFPSFKGQIVSLIPQNNNCEMYTTNLKYALHGNVNNYTNLSSNESLNETFTIESSAPVIIFCAHQNL